MNSIESYIKKLKSKLNEDIFSPAFLRLANLYFINEQYEDCINVCTIGLQVFPEYTTAKLLLIKALLKLGYVSEAENKFAEVRHKITNLKIYEELRKLINELKNKTGQERIFYPENIHPSIEFEYYEDKIAELNETNVSIEFDEFRKLMESHALETTIEENKYKSFSDNIHNFKFDTNIISNVSKPDSALDITKEQDITSIENLFLVNIKILTETIADIYYQQGFLREAFEAYNILLRKDNTNKARILEKLNELERSLSSQNKNRK